MIARKSEEARLARPMRILKIVRRTQSMDRCMHREGRTLGHPQKTYMKWDPAVSALILRRQRTTTVACCVGMYCRPATPVLDRCCLNELADPLSNLYCSRIRQICAWVPAAAVTIDRTCRVVCVTYKLLSSAVSGIGVGGLDRSHPPTLLIKSRCLDCCSLCDYFAVSCHVRSMLTGFEGVSSGDAGSPKRAGART